MVAALSAIKSKLDPTANKPSLQKAKLYYQVPGRQGQPKSIECQFNPQTLTISKGVSWQSAITDPDSGKVIPNQELNAPPLRFRGGESAIFSLDLVFDTTVLDNQDVRGFTNQLLALTLKGAGDSPKPKDPPPVVQFVWGDIMLFVAVIIQVQIAYTLFLASGVPVRARARVQFQQAFDGDAPKGAQNPTSRTDPRKTHIVQIGDRLDYLAFMEYGNPARWREIAEANDLDDPLAIKPGQILVLPQDI
jgi:hypothetical protein